MRNAFPTVSKMAAFPLEPKFTKVLIMSVHLDCKDVTKGLLMNTIVLCMIHVCLFLFWIGRISTVSLGLGRVIALFAKIMLQ